MDGRLPNLVLTAVAVTIIATGCSGGGGSVRAPVANANAIMQAQTPTSGGFKRESGPPMDVVSAASVTDMARRTPQSQIQALGWTQLPGAAQYVAASPDGTLWAIGSAPYNSGGSLIFHYVNGTWIYANGVAARVAIGPNGTAYAVQASGMVYVLSGTTWSVIGCCASDVSVAVDGSLYAIASGTNAIFHYVNGVLTQLPGAGVRVAGSWDSGNYPGGLNAGGYYVVNAQGLIYYFSPGIGYIQLPGAAVQVAPTNQGGLFALGNDGNPNHGIYYYDLNAGGWTQQPGAANSIAAGTANVYATNTTGAIFQSASAATAASPMAINVVDYFTNARIAANVIVDGVSVANPLSMPIPAQGIHTLQIAASGYATYHGAIQVPGGATTRTIAMFPVTAAMTAWLAQVNSDRSTNGSGPVQLDDMLSIAAFDHAVDMGTQGYFAHFDPHGFAPTTRSLLLGSMLVGAENIAGGYQSWTTAEQAFMAEKSSLPNQTVSDCVKYDSLAGHYCNITWASHNWVGLAIAHIPASALGYYYDQEFGDYYTSYDTSVVQPEPALGTQASLSLAAVAGTSVTGLDLGIMAAPQPISITTLNADPTCASSCPTADQWYPPTVSYVGAKAPFAINLTQNQIYFALSTTSAPSIFAGYGSYAAYWAGGSVLPDQYANASVNVQSQSTLRKPTSAEPQGRLVPNGPELYSLPR